MITITIKKRTEAGQWQPIPAADLVGKTMLVFFQQSDGQEIVAEINLEGRRLFFCGTDHWLERMKEKGEAVKFDYAIQRLKKVKPELLAEIIPDVACLAAEIFEGEIAEHKILTGVKK